MNEPSFGKQYIKDGLNAIASFMLGILVFALGAAIIVFVIFALNGFSWGSEYQLCVNKNAKTYKDSTGTYSLIDNDVIEKCLGIDD